MMPIKLTELIERVPPAVEEKVRRVRDQVQPAVREALRAECRLMFRTPEEAEQKRPGAQVPVEVAPGYPAVLKDVQFPDDFERIMLLGRYRALLEQARSGASGLLRLRDELLGRPEPDKWVSASAADLQSVANWAAALLKVLDQHDPLKKVLSIREDFLGIYQYDASDLLADERAVNRATIRLYWGVIGLVSEWFGCGIEDLAIVVLTHELAHAYTQLGADIEGRRWAAPSFAKAETALKEGLAQYYTDRVLRRLERRYGGALNVFLGLLPGQPEPYRAHQPWVETSSPEAVRRAMLEVRRWNEGKLADFNRRLGAAQKELAPKA
ncbi:MAG: hypothetical protein OJF62_001930 [Pseudolabrys sp.]|jgi:hypothetical protein|nr:hypothetical protein [Pseudolabrys sp.]